MVEIPDTMPILPEPKQYRKWKRLYCCWTKDADGLLKKLQKKFPKVKFKLGGYDRTLDYAIGLNSARYILCYELNPHPNEETQTICSYLHNIDGKAIDKRLNG